MTDAHPFSVVADATALLAMIGERPARRVLLFGAPGAGKSTLAAHLARTLEWPVTASAASAPIPVRRRLVHRER